MNIKISKNAHSCAACEVHFSHEQAVNSSVRVVEGALRREDFCKECWADQKNKKAYSVWKMVYLDPKSVEEETPEVFSPLRQLFYEAAGEESRVEMAKAFLAAGLLRRQKVFRLIKESDESDGEVRVTLYTDRIGSRLIEVPDPQFSYAEMEEARNLLLVRLQELEKLAENDAAEPSSPTAENGEESAPSGDAPNQDNSVDASEEPDAESSVEGEPAEEQVPLTSDDVEDEEEEAEADTELDAEDDELSRHEENLAAVDDENNEEKVEVDVHSGVASSLDAEMTPHGEETAHV